MRLLLVSWCAESLIILGKKKKKPGCGSGFPKPFRDVTTVGEDSYPQYRRLQNERFVLKGRFKLGNDWVVPYNPALLKKYRTHLNVAHWAAPGGGPLWTDD
eukprot:Sspe_Gene.79813::Locus_50146_Transcript_1_1_Confidence_1.000_Length_633::g.79813::m.79813